MTPITDQGDAYKSVTEAHLRVREHTNTETFARFADWIDALAASNQAAMVSCRPDDLAAIQIRLKQLIALRDALSTRDGAPVTNGVVLS